MAPRQCMNRAPRLHRAGQRARAGQEALSGAHSAVAARSGESHVHLALTRLAHDAPRCQFELRFDRP